MKKTLSLVLLLTLVGSVKYLPPNRRDVGFLFQNYALWPHMTVYDNNTIIHKSEGICSVLRRRCRRYEDIRVIAAASRPPQ